MVLYGNLQNFFCVDEDKNAFYPIRKDTLRFYWFCKTSISLVSNLAILFAHLFYLIAYK